MSNRICLIASDEEDEDGNLSERGRAEKAANNEIVPMGEVVYLSEDNSCFQPEEDEITDRKIPVVYMNANSDCEDDVEDNARKRSGGRNVSRNCRNRSVMFTVENQANKNNLPKSELVLGIADSPIVLNEEQTEIISVKKIKSEPDSQINESKTLNEHVVHGERRWNLRRNRERQQIEKDPGEKNQNKSYASKHNENEIKLSEKRQNQPKNKQITSNLSKDDHINKSNSSENKLNPLVTSDNKQDQSKQAETKQNESEKSVTTQSKADIKKLLESGTLKAAALMPPPMKRGNPYDNSGARKPKYARQATPICDAIMKEYSKRQKLMKGQGNAGPPDLSDLPIQDILNRAKKGATEEIKKSFNFDSNKTIEKTVNKSTNIVVSSNSNKEPPALEQRDPLFVSVKKEVDEIGKDVDIKPVIRAQSPVDIKPVFVNLTQSLVDVKPIIINSTRSSVNTSVVANTTCTVESDKTELLSMRKKGRRGYGDDDDDYVPSSVNATVVPMRRRGRPARRSVDYDDDDYVPSSVHKTPVIANTVYNSDESNVPKGRRGRPAPRSGDNDNLLSPVNKTPVIANAVCNSDETELMPRRRRGRPARRSGVNDNLPSSVNTTPVIADKDCNFDESNKTDLGTQQRKRGRPTRRDEDYDPTYVPGKKKQQPHFRNTRSNKSKSEELLENNPKNKLPTNDLRPQSSLNEIPQESLLSQKATKASTILVPNENPSLREQTQPSASAPKLEVLNIATRVKLIAEKIANLLSNESTPNILSETKKLFQTTQELLKLQEKAMQQTSGSTSLQETQCSTVHIKQESQEIPDELGNGSSVEFENKDTNVSEYSTDVVNQLHTQYSVLKKMLGETSVDEVKSNAPSNLPHCKVTLEDLIKSQLKSQPVSKKRSENIPEFGQHSLEIQATDSNIPLTPQAVTVQDKCTFVMEYFTSYQEVFDNQLNQNDIPLLAEIILLCMDDLTQCLQRTKNAQSFTSEELRRQESELAKQSYLKVVMTYGEKFLPIFNLTISRITKTKTVKALIVTLVLYITVSLVNKAPKYKKQIHRVRRVMLFMLKVHKHYHHLVWEVLEASANVYEGELNLLLKILKYFQKRNFVSIPFGEEFNYEYDKLEEELCGSTELTLMATSTSPINHQKEVYQTYNSENFSSISESNQSHKLSDIAAQFVEALQSERQCNTKRIEEKLDNILNVLSGNSELQADSYALSGHQAKKKIDGSHGVSFSESDLSPNHSRGIMTENSHKLTNYDQFGNAKTFHASPSCSLPKEKDNLLAQLLENDHAGLDSLFASYMKSKKMCKAQIKLEPQDFDDNSPEMDTQTSDGFPDSNNQVVNEGRSVLHNDFVGVKQELEQSYLGEESRVPRVCSVEGMSSENNSSSQEESDPLAFETVSVWGGPTSYTTQQSGSTFTTLQGQCEFDDMFTEEPFTFPKPEKVEMDFDT